MHLIVNLRICIDLALIHSIIHQAHILYGQVTVRGREAGHGTCTTLILASVLKAR